MTRSKPPPGWKPRPVTEVCDGFDFPINPWTADDVRFWTATPSYSPWRDVAAFFVGTAPDDMRPPAVPVPNVAVRVG